jgi:dihydroorotate dehydrogenase (NAD+) catalytic subunit
MPSLSQEVCGLRFRNPILLASGIVGISGDLLLRAEKAGAGGVVTKSVGISPKGGHATPTVVELPYGLLNAMGLPNAGWKEFLGEMESVRLRIPLIVSIFGANANEFSFLANALSPRADAFELNLSCPHAAGFGAELGADPRIVEKVTRRVASSTDKPFFVKLTPNTNNIVGLARAAERGGAHAVSAINTLKAMAIDPDFGVPILSNRYGGLSGPCIKPIGVRCVYELFQAVRVPIIGMGGIMTGRDAAEYLMAGASLLQTGTAVWEGGMEAFGVIARELEDFLKKKRTPLRRIIGMAHRDVSKKP